MERLNKSFSFKMKLIFQQSSFLIPLIIGNLIKSNPPISYSEKFRFILRLYVDCSYYDILRLTGSGNVLYNLTPPVRKGWGRSPSSALWCLKWKIYVKLNTVYLNIQLLILISASDTASPGIVMWLENMIDDESPLSLSNQI